MANNSIGSTPIIRISQLPTETELTISGNPANTWFAIVNVDEMRTKKLSLEALLKFIALYLKPSEVNFINLIPQGGITSPNSTVYLGNTLYISDTITFDKANNAFNAANAASNTANAAFVRANQAYFVANNAFIKANSSYAHANSAYDKANSHIILNTEGGIRIDGTLKTRNVYLGNTIELSDNVTYEIANNANVRTYLPITINTYGGLTGGKDVRLGESIDLTAEYVYNHSNSAYNYANNCMINPAINYVTSSTSAFANNRYIVLANNVTLTLQSNPKVNTYVYITNMTFGKTNKINPGSSRIHGLAVGEEVVLDIWNVSIDLCYIDATRGWVLV